MKIVHVCLCGPFNERYAYQDNLLPKYHRKLGNEVTIITTPYGKFLNGNSGNEIVAEGVSILDDGTKVIRLKALLPQKINMHIYAYWGLEKVLNQEQPDFVFVHGVESINYTVLPNYKKKHPKVKIVFDNHTDEINSLHHWSTRLYSKLFIKGFIVPKLIPIAEWFYGTTPVRNDFLIDHYSIPADKVKLLPMGADDEEMHFEQKENIREEVRKQYGITSDDFLIVTGGKIDPLKNIHVLAEAVARSEYKHIKILIFGSIQEQLVDFFKSIESDRVQCIGWQPSNKVYRFFYAADMVMFPGLHSVMWEQAVASCVPCAFSRIKGFEHIDIGGNCVLMEGNNVGYYMNLIEDLYNNTQRISSMKKIANSEKSKQFLYSRIAQSVIDDVH